MPTLIWRLAAALLVIAVMGATAPRAAETAINVTKENVAIGGYDTVSYFMPAGARRGTPEHQTEWNGAIWHFATAENLAAFQAAPERYAPQFGGWCAYALSTGQYAAEVDPREAFTVHDGKLYLNWSRRVMQRWLKAVDDNIVTGEKNWPVVRQQLLDDEAKISRKWF